MDYVHLIDSDNLGPGRNPTADGVDDGGAPPERKGRLPKHRAPGALLENDRDIDGPEAPGN